MSSRGIGKITLSRIINQGLNNVAKEKTEVNSFYNFIKKEVFKLQSEINFNFVEN